MELLREQGASYSKEPWGKMSWRLVEDKNVTCLVKFPQWRLYITRKAFRDKFCFPFAVSEQSTGGRMESRLVGVTLVFLISNIAMSS